MNKEAITDRKRKVGILCHDFTRNFAYFKAGDESEGSKNDFIQTVQNNFFDATVLSFCKLFGKGSEEHRWEEVINDSEFKSRLLLNTQMTENEFDEICKKFTDCRNMVIAHQDLSSKIKKKSISYPYLNQGFPLIKFYYLQISIPDTGWPADLDAEYRRYNEEALSQYRQCVH